MMCPQLNNSRLNVTVEIKHGQREQTAGHTEV